MSVPVNKTLLALSLALKDVEAPLSEKEQKAVRNAVYQLKLEPDDWENYEPDLLKVIQANPNLNQLYQTTKSKLDALSDGIPSNLRPTPEELEQAAILTYQNPVARGLPPVNDYQESNEIQNIVFNTLDTSKPEETAKKLSYWERVKQIIQQR